APTGWQRPRRSLVGCRWPWRAASGKGPCEHRARLRSALAMLAIRQHCVKSNQFNDALRKEARSRLERGALHQLEQDALADAAVGDAQPGDGPGGADRIEDRAAAEHE